MRESDGGAGNVFMILFHTRVFRALYLPTPFPRGLGEFYPRVSTGRARITLEPRFADADLAVEAQIQGPGAANGEREVSMTRQLSFEPLLCLLFGFEKLSCKIHFLLLLWKFFLNFIEKGEHFVFREAPGTKSADCAALQVSNAINGVHQLLRSSGQVSNELERTCAHGKRIRCCILRIIVRDQAVTSSVANASPSCM